MGESHEAKNWWLRLLLTNLAINALLISFLLLLFTANTGLFLLKFIYIYKIWKCFFHRKCKSSIRYKLKLFFVFLLESFSFKMKRWRRREEDCFTEKLWGRLCILLSYFGFHISSCKLQLWCEKNRNLLDVDFLVF